MSSILFRALLVAVYQMVDLIQKGIVGASAGCSKSGRHNRSSRNIGASGILDQRVGEEESHDFSLVRIQRKPSCNCVGMECFQDRNANADIQVQRWRGHTARAQTLQQLEILRT